MSWKLLLIRASLRCVSAFGDMQLVYVVHHVWTPGGPRGDAYVDSGRLSVVRRRLATFRCRGAPPSSSSRLEALVAVVAVSDNLTVNSYCDLNRS